MKGWKTFLFNAGITAVPAALAWLASYDWTQHVSPTVALVIVGGVNLALRAVTSTPIFKKG